MKKSVSCHVRRLLVFLSIVLFAVGASSPVLAEDIILNAGGASFPAPLYFKWFKDYSRTHPNTHITYRHFGSGAGVSNFIAKRLDFAGTDVPMTPEEVEKAGGEVIQAPMIAGAVVLIYNLEGIKDLRLSREAQQGIFLGTIKNWRDPIIARDNMGIDLPDLEITLVVRNDSSGTTHVLTEHLSAACEQFAKTVGVTKKPVWPESISQEGRLIKATGNGGLAQMVKGLPGSIGYVEYSYAYFTDIAMATLQNKAGRFVAPTTHSFLETVAMAGPLSVSTDSSVIPADPSAKGAYPILTLTWMVCYKTYHDPLKLKTIKDVLSYCLDEGQRYAIQTGYIPLVEPLLSEARAKVDSLTLK